ncbi:unnamed protein product, partial [Ixodes persulcatus]
LSDLDLGQSVTLPASQEPPQPGSPLASSGAPDTDDVIVSGVSPEELPERALDVFFPHPVQNDSGCYTRVHHVPKLSGWTPRSPCMSSRPPSTRPTPAVHLA